MSEFGGLGFEVGKTDVFADVDIETLGIFGPANDARVLQHLSLGILKRQAILDRLLAGHVDAFEQFPVPLQDIGAGLAMTGQPDGAPGVFFQRIVSLEGA